MKRVIIFAFLAILNGFGVPNAQAETLDVSPLFSNIGFESGNLNGWKVTRPNNNYVASLSPAVNPSIDPADPANNPTLLSPPNGSFFTGLKRPGDYGPDLSYKLVHEAISVSVPADTKFQVNVFANRGRLEPFDTPGATGTVLVRIFGWTTGGTVPSVNPSNDNWSRTINWNPSAQSFDFAGVPDGTWGQRSFVFDPSADGVNPADLKSLSLSVAAQNHNHDQYIAIDIPIETPLPDSVILGLEDREGADSFLVLEGFKAGRTSRANLDPISF